MAQIFVPNSWGNVSGPVAEWIRKLAESLDRMANGSSRTVSTLTLTANAGSTTITDPHVAPASHITLVPTTSNAAAALATTYVSARTNGASFTLTHANNAQADRTFTYEIRNG